MNFLNFPSAVALLCGVVLLAPFVQARAAIVAWGNRPNPVLDIPPGLNDVTAVAAGFSHALALKADGTVVAWGNNGVGQTDVPPGLSHVVAIDATFFGSAALRTDGSVVVWGQIDTVVANDFKQLDVTDGVRLVAGGGGLVVVRKNGQINGYGWMGDKPSFDDYSSFPSVSLSPTSPTHLLALTPQGRVEYWGNWFLQVNHLSDIRSLSLGAGHALFLKDDGTPLALGDNNYGQSSVPDSLYDIHSVVAGDRISAAIYRKDRILKTWGETFSGANNPPLGLHGVESLVFGKGGGAFAIVKDRVVHGALATAELVNGFLVRIRIEDGGYGYTEPPRIEIEGGGATSQARVTAIVAHSRLEEIVVEDAGFGYQTVPKINIAPPTTPPKLVARVSQVQLSFGVFAGGEYQLYASTNLTDWVPQGQPFFANQNLIQLQQPTTTPIEYFKLELLSREPTLLPPLDWVDAATFLGTTTLHRARAVAEVVNGFVVGVKIVDPGMGYMTPPLVSLAGGGGMAARATAVISNRTVVEIRMVNAGSKYTNAPVVLIGAPLIPPTLQMVPSQYSVTLNVTPGRRYLLQGSKDSLDWSSIGGSFVATATSMVVNHDALAYGPHLRLIEVP